MDYAGAILNIYDIRFQCYPERVLVFFLHHRSEILYLTPLHNIDGAPAKSSPHHTGAQYGGQGFCLRDQKIKLCTAYLIKC